MKWNHTLKGKSKRLLMNKRRDCVKNNVPFDLDEIWYRDRIEAGCALTGLPFKIDATKTDPMSPSVDRINPDGGYIKSNCRMILHSLNMFKGGGDDNMMYMIASVLLERKGNTDVDVQIEQYHQTYKVMHDDNLVSYVVKMLLEQHPTYLLDEQMYSLIEDSFTNRQLELIFKKYNQLPLTKTEMEYYSRIIKKRLKGMLNVE